MSLLREPVRGQRGRLGPQPVAQRRGRRRERVLAGGGRARPETGHQQRPGVTRARPHVVAIEGVRDRGQGLGRPPLGQPPLARPAERGRGKLQRPLDDLAGFVPSAQRHQRLGHVVGQHRAVGPGEPVFPGGAQPVPGHCGRRLVQACTLQHVRLGNGGAQQRLVGVHPRCDGPGLGQHGPDPFHVPADRLGAGQGDQCRRLGSGVTGAPRRGDRLFGDRTQSGVMPAAMDVGDTSDGRGPGAEARPGPAPRRCRSLSARPGPA